MQDLTRQEQIVLNSIFFLGKCRISYIRTFIKHTTPMLFNTKDLTTDLPLKLEKLRSEGWIMIQEDKFYSCTGKTDYAWLKNAIKNFDFCTQLNGYSTLINEFCNYELERLSEHICMICAVGYFLLGDAEQAQGMDDFFKKWHHRYYYSAYALPVHQKAIQYLMSFPDFQKDMQNLPISLIMVSLPDCILSSFINGRTLPDWRSIYKNAPEKLVMNAIPSLLCAAFMENDRQQITALMNWSFSTQNIEIGEALFFMLSGEWKQADQKFTHYINTVNLTGNRQNPQIIMLIIFALIPACVVNAASSRVLKWLDFLSNSFYSDALIHIKYHFSALYKCLSGSPVSQNDASYALALPIYRVIGFPVFCLNQKLELPPHAVEESIQMAKDLLGKKQIPLGVYLLNSAGTLLPEADPQRLEIEALSEKYDIVPFFQMTERKSEWESILQAFEKIIPVVKQEKMKQNDNQKIAWLLISKEDKTARGDIYESLTGIKPVFLHTNRHGTVEMKEFSGSKLLKGSLDQYLSPQEQAIKGFVNRSYYYDSDIELEAVKLLENSESVYLNNPDHPVRLVPEKNTILSKLNKDDSVELKLKYFPDYICGSYAIFLDTSEENICRYCKVLHKDQLLSIFEVNADEHGKIKIPREGLKKLADIAARMSATVPFSGPLSSEAYRDLPQINGNIEFHVQISREQNMFTFEIRNRPCAETAWFIKPGYDPEQKILELHGIKSLLKRNLSLEKKKIRELLEKCPSLPNSVKSDYSFDLDEPEQVLTALAELKESGFILDWNSGSPLKISRKLDYTNLRFSKGEGMDWLSIGGELQVSPDNVIQLTALLNALDKRTGCFIELDEHSYLQLTRDLLKKLEILKVSGNIADGHLKVSSAALPMLSTVFESGLPEKLQEHIRQIKEAFQKKIELPLNFHGVLRSYQEDGFRYLARLADCRIGSCIADDMGLGKTIQILALLLREAKHGPALVVVPASLCRNWEREAQKFAPSLNTILLPAFDREKTVHSASKGDVLICSYGILSSEENLFAGKKWHIVVLDEAQAIKNDSAKRTKSTKTLQADIRIVSTGTPIENHLMDLWSIFDFLNPGLLGSSKEFESKFCVNGMPRPELKKLVSPLIIRRKKEDVLDDLPPKTEITLSFELSEKERNMYEILRQKAISELENQELSHITILAHLTKLRRFCCDPSLIWKDQTTGTKLQKLLELVENLKSAGHRALIFSQYVDFLTVIRKAFDEKGFSYQYLDGSCSLSNRMQAVDDFQNGSGDFFLISLKAGGTGLNLTAANYVILTDPWWNPAVEDQASDRVHRIGQHEPVTVYRLIMEKTVEERVLELHARKKFVSEDILSNTKNTALSISELMSLFNV